MQKFTPIEYVKIDIANQMGYDKWLWQERIEWVNDHEDKLDFYIEQADKPLLYIKAVRALRDAKAGNPTGYIMGLDSTASGLQAMAALSGCFKTASNVNLVDTGNREDIYEKVANGMNKLNDFEVNRGIVKKPIMTTMYGSTKQPEEVFGEATPELEAFYDMLYQECPGPVELLVAIQSCWNPLGLEHSWTMPDGVKIECKVMGVLESSFKIDELDKAEVTYATTVNRPQKKGLSLAANVTHSVDAYIVREMVRRLHKLDIQMAPIHDCFYARPQYMNKVRSTYIQIMAEIADSSLMQDIFRELTGDPKAIYTKCTNKLGDHIRKAEFALS